MRLVREIWLVMLLALVAGLPLVPCFLWFRARKMGAACFLLSLGSGFLAAPAAAFVQTLIPAAPGGGPLLDLLLRVALVEEACRLVFLIPARRLAPVWDGGLAPGVAAGLGFAAAESAFYGAVSPGALALRAVTAAPLHAACGARAGRAVTLAPERPLWAAARFGQAVAVHLAYDFIVMTPGAPSFLAALVAFTALWSCLRGSGGAAR